MREREVEGKFREAVKRAGGKAYKFISPGNSGVPDRLVVMPGGHIGFVEIKALGKKPTPRQRVRMRELEGLGCCVRILDDPGEIPEIVTAICQNGTCPDPLLEGIGGRP